MITTTGGGPAQAKPTTITIPSSISSTTSPSRKKKTEQTNNKHFEITPSYQADDFFFLRIFLQLSNHDGLFRDSSSLDSNHFIFAGRMN